jgi:glycosyltransferase involved in cell wall biosynthesis
MPLKNNMRVEFCLPIYNEEAILADSTQKLYDFLSAQNFSFAWQIVIVINGSSDSSPLIAKRLSLEYPDKIKFANINEPGRGQALKRYWLTSSADIFVYMDIDLAVSLEAIPQLIQPILDNECQLVVGSRLLPNSKIERSFIRELSSRTYNFLSRVLFKHRLSDMQCGFKAIGRSAFMTIAPHLQDPHWFFDTEMIIIGRALGYKIKEIPVDWQENRYDKRKSKVKLLYDSTRMFKSLIQLRRRLKKMPNYKN